MSAKFSGVTDIIFDVDKTLRPDDPRISEAMMDLFYREVARVHGVSNAAGKALFESTIAKLGGHTKTLNTLLGDGVGSVFIDEAWEQVPLEEFINEDPKLVAMMQTLSGAYRLSILSNGNTSGTLRRKVKCLGIDPGLFVEILGSSDSGITHQKPDPEIFLLMCTRLGIQPQQAVYVGDDVEKDVLGANRVGMYSVLVGADDSRATACIATIYDLVEILL